MALQTGRFLKIVERQRVFAQHRQVARPEEVSLGRLGVDVETMAQEVEYGSVMPRLLLPYSLQEEIVVPSTVVVAQRVGNGQNDRFLRFFLSCRRHNLPTHRHNSDGQQQVISCSFTHQRLCSSIISHPCGRSPLRRAPSHRARLRSQTAPAHNAPPPSVRCARRRSPRSRRWRN